MVKPEIVVSPDYKSCHHQPNDIYMIAWSFPLFKYAAMKCMVSLSLLALLGISGCSALFTKVNISGLAAYNICYPLPVLMHLYCEVFMCNYTILHRFATASSVFY